ncbi:MAG TPA: hydroxymethylpyrimidine/phosphomethylpyrimidine kinase [Steroidobacteraceae bacterium]|nr:hydroxymethylpyrimidine/phosphomethylpyrimidine kinase [Steroidobacteraceae bacterium]
MIAVLVIAGTDSSGGAGLTRDVATLAHFGVDARCAVTAVTAQSPSGVALAHVLPPDAVRAQLSTALAAGWVGAIKIGMLGTAATVAAVAAGLSAAGAIPLVLDPVLAASAGGELLDAAGRRALLAQLLPRATLVTPNIPEAATLLGTELARSPDEQIAQARALCELGASAVLLKGGHAQGPAAVDCLATRAGAVHTFSAPRSAAQRRGTGCTLASGVAAGLAVGLPLVAACERAKRHVTELLRASP